MSQEQTFLCFKCGGIEGPMKPCKCPESIQRVERLHKFFGQFKTIEIGDVFGFYLQREQEKEIANDK